jgi:hypothetical protein
LVSRPARGPDGLAKAYGGGKAVAGRQLKVDYEQEHDDELVIVGTPADVDALLERVRGSCRTNRRLLEISIAGAANECSGQKRSSSNSRSFKERTADGFK